MFALLSLLPGPIHQSNKKRSPRQRRRSIRKVISWCLLSVFEAGRGWRSSGSSSSLLLLLLPPTEWLVQGPINQVDRRTNGRWTELFVCCFCGPFKNICFLLLLQQQLGHFTMSCRAYRYFCTAAEEEEEEACQRQTLILMIFRRLWRRGRKTDRQAKVLFVNMPHHFRFVLPTPQSSETQLQANRRNRALPRRPPCCSVVCCKLLEYAAGTSPSSDQDEEEEEEDEFDCRIMNFQTEAPPTKEATRWRHVDVLKMGDKRCIVRKGSFCYSTTPTAALSSSSSLLGIGIGLPTLYGFEQCFWASINPDSVSLQQPASDFQDRADYLLTWSGLGNLLNESSSKNGSPLVVNSPRRKEGRIIGYSILIGMLIRDAQEGDWNGFLLQMKRGRKKQWKAGQRAPSKVYSAVVL